MSPLIKTLFLTIVLILNSCNSNKTDINNSKIVYQSDDLIITQLTNNVYEHTSFFNSQSFGRVPCNGMIVTDKGEAIIFDTPTDNKSSAELINWIKQNLNSKINAVIPTHFHEDCLGGLKEFEKDKVPSYANFKTIELARENNLDIPTNGFEKSLILNVGNKKVYAKFFGEGHTKDNVVGYFPSENVMFGGCLIKELNAGKGNLEDANVKDWSKTVEKVKNEYSDVKIIIPGHGNTGNKALLDYTMNLFKSE